MLKTTTLAWLLSSVALAHPVSGNFAPKPQVVLTNLDQARALKATVLSSDPGSNVAVAHFQPEQLEKLSLLNHFQGRCGGFEVLSDEESNQPGLVLKNLLHSQLKIQNQISIPQAPLSWREDFQQIANQADPESLRQTVQWISSYPSRHDRLPNPNQHVLDLKTKLESWLQDAPWPFAVETIEHKSTQQKSLKLSIPGASRPEQIIVLGAHFDSISRSSFGNSTAPGADDNASGSSNLIEALKLLKKASRPERTLEFYWYAGEESGLLGSAEIAKAARAENRQVLAVLQLDMTLHPGSGEQVIGSIEDFTSPWLRDLFTQINDLYVQARLLPDRCGYGCSDHASWFRQSYHAIAPFEALTKNINRSIHSEKDVISSKLSFEHSTSFTKFAVLFALVLGQTDIHPPAP